MSLIDKVFTLFFGKEKLKQMIEESRQKTEQLNQELKNAGCYEIYQSIMESMRDKDEQKLAHIMKTAPEFNMDLMTSNGSTLLTALVVLMPRVSLDTLDLILKRHPNPFKRDYNGHTASQLLQDMIDLDNDFFTGLLIPRNKDIYYIEKLHSRLNDYKIEYAAYAAAKENTHLPQKTDTKTQPFYVAETTDKSLYVPEFAILLALSQPNKTLRTGNTSPSTKIVAHQDTDIWHYDGRERTN